MTTQHRNNMIKLIHVGKKTLCLENDTYRAMLIGETGKDSTKKMSDYELDKVLARLRKSGFKRSIKANTRPLADDTMSQKIRALWLLLVELKAVNNASEAALGAYVKRQTGVDALQWLDKNQSTKVIESLKKWIIRPLSKQVQCLHSQADNLIQEGDDVDVCLAVAYQQQTFEPMLAAYKALRQLLTD